MNEKTIKLTEGCPDSLGYVYYNTGRHSLSVGDCVKIVTPNRTINAVATYSTDLSCDNCVLFQLSNEWGDSNKFVDCKGIECDDFVLQELESFIDGAL